MEAKDDNMSLEMILQVLDEDKDGFIGIDDIMKICEDVGWSVKAEKIEEIIEKIGAQGDKLSKMELAQIFWM